MPVLLQRGCPFEDSDRRKFDRGSRRQASTIPTAVTTPATASTTQRSTEGCPRGSPQTLRAWFRSRLPFLVSACSHTWELRRSIRLSMYKCHSCGRSVVYSSSQDRDDVEVPMYLFRSLDWDLDRLQLTFMCPHTGEIETFLLDAISGVNPLDAQKRCARITFYASAIKRVQRELPRYLPQVLRGWYTDCTQARPRPLTADGTSPDMFHGDTKSILSQTNNITGENNGHKCQPRYVSLWGPNDGSFGAPNCNHLVGTRQHANAPF